MPSMTPQPRSPELTPPSVPGGTGPPQSEEGSGLAPLTSSGRPSTASVPSPPREQRTSSPASSSTYRFPSRGPSPRASPLVDPPPCSETTATPPQVTSTS